MSPLASIFQNRKALIPYITAGDPDLKTTVELVRKLELAGADAVELGVPFSDSLADGPVIVASHQRSLRQKTSLAQVISLVNSLKQQVSIPLILMLSYNLVFHYGVERYITACRLNGIAGSIIPDLPPEEAPKDLNPIYLITPTTDSARRLMIAQATQGFIYLVSSTGVTGERSSFSATLSELAKDLRRITDQPIAVGFGISSPEMAKEVSRFADGVIVGSALVKRLVDSPTEGIAFIHSIRKALDNVN